ncbi:MAG TPA: amine oxidase, partial [Bradyrhizobium sp.]|nr:amine oxidase [Bradyrhizobium sp.]
MRQSSLAVLPAFKDFGNHAMTMTRRGFLSASAALASAPAWSGGAFSAALPRDADIVVIG